jgi:hypothetical protein
LRTGTSDKVPAEPARATTRRSSGIFRDRKSMVAQGAYLLLRKADAKVTRDVYFTCSCVDAARRSCRKAPPYSMLTAAA